MSATMNTISGHPDYGTPYTETEAVVAAMRYSEHGLREDRQAIAAALQTMGRADLETLYKAVRLLETEIQMAWRKPKE